MSVSTRIKQSMLIYVGPMPTEEQLQGFTEGPGLSATIGGLAGAHALALHSFTEFGRKADLEHFDFAQKSRDEAEAFKDKMRAGDAAFQAKARAREAAFRGDVRVNGAFGSRFDAEHVLPSGRDGIRSDEARAAARKIAREAYIRDTLDPKYLPNRIGVATAAGVSALGFGNALRLALRKDEPEVVKTSNMNDEPYAEYLARKKREEAERKKRQALTPKQSSVSKLELLDALDNKDNHAWARQQPQASHQAFNVTGGAVGGLMGSAATLGAILEGGGHFERRHVPIIAGIAGAGGLATGAFMGLATASKKNRERRNAIIAAAMEDGTLPGRMGT